MKTDAEKLINMSLTKIAETHTVRRGGNNLHKHLLISSVLTKARSAYFDTWYSVDPNSEHVRPSGAPKLVESENENSTKFNPPIEPTIESTNPSLFQLDGTDLMELPKDIVTCVEKMQSTPSPDPPTSPIPFNLADNEIELELVKYIGLDCVDAGSEIEKSSFSYLDLISSDVSGEVSSPMNQNSTLPFVMAEQSKKRRRRDWRFDEDENEEEDFQYFGSKRFCIDSTMTGDSFPLSSLSRTPLEPFFTFKSNNFHFRTKKSVFDDDGFEDDGTSSDEDHSPFSFGDEEEVHNSLVSEEFVQTRQPLQHLHVPSQTSSQSSSSDEDEVPMDVDLDKIIDLVQFFSFAKKKEESSGSSKSVTTNQMGPSPTPSTFVRSMSTPDLFKRSEDDPNDEKTKNPFGFLHSPNPQRLLPLKV